MRAFLPLVFFLSGFAGFLLAKGTPAGIPINNIAEIAYTVNGVSSNFASNTDSFVVDQVVDIHVDWQDTESVKVFAGSHDRVLTFRVTNEGNGDENLTIGRDHNTSSDFTPDNLRIFFDADHNGIFDPAIDSIVTNPLHLNSDTNVTLFLVGDIPDNNTTQAGAKAFEILRIASQSNATVGADDPAVVDTVIRKGEDNASGIYEVFDFWLESNKTVRIHSDDNATHTGTRITYTIAVGIGGNATGRTIGHVVIRDAIPAGTQYLPGTLHRDDTLLTDASDGDGGECDGTTLRVELGDLHGDTIRKVTFDVRVQ